MVPEQLPVGGLPALCQPFDDSGDVPYFAVIESEVIRQQGVFEHREHYLLDLFMSVV